MTVHITYDISMDAQYLCMWWQDTEKTRYFVAGEGITVARGAPVPKEVRHQVTKLILVELLDELLANGIRPSSNAWMAGHVADLKAHIAFAEKMALTLVEPHAVKNA